MGWITSVFQAIGNASPIGKILIGLAGIIEVGITYACMNEGDFPESFIGWFMIHIFILGLVASIYFGIILLRGLGELML